MSARRPSRCTCDFPAQSRPPTGTAARAHSIARNVAVAYGDLWADVASPPFGERLRLHMASL